MSSRTYIRCCLCGKISDPLRGNWEGPHRLDTLIQEFVGRGRGTNGGAFIWKKIDQEGNEGFIKKLLMIVEAAHKRLTLCLKVISGRTILRELVQPVILERPMEVTPGVDPVMLKRTILKSMVREVEKIAIIERPMVRR